MSGTNRTRATKAASPASLSMRGQSRAAAVLVTGAAAATFIAHTFSISGLPSRPVGRKMSTITRIENAATSLYSVVK